MNQKFTLIISICIWFGFASCNSVIADEGEQQCKQKYMDCMVQYNVKQDEYEKIKATKITTQECKDKKATCEKNGGKECGQVLNDCFRYKNKRNREIEKELSVLNKSLKKIQRQCEKHFHNCRNANYEAKEAQKLADEREAKETEKLRKQAEAQQVVDAEKEKENLARKNKEKQTLIKQAEFQKEHPDFVPVDGFKYLKFGLSKDEVDQVLLEEGAKHPQYKKYDFFIVDFLPVFQQNIMANLTYDESPKVLSEITLGTMEVQGQTIDTTGVMFVDTKPKKSLELPTCADGETLIKGALNKWKNIVLHEKSSVTVTETGTKIDIELYVLNYGTVTMMIRRYKLPRYLKSQQRKANGWHSEEMTIISLRYYDFDKGMRFWKILQEKKAQKSKGMSKDASF